MSKNKFDELTKNSKETVLETVKKDKNKEITQREIDSIKKIVSNKINNSFIPIPNSAKKNILKEIEKETKDTTSIKLSNGNKISFNGSSRIDKFVQFQKKYPDAKIDHALDSLNYDKNFTNRFLYTRAKAANSLVKKENRDKFVGELISYASISLFIFLPIFTLFLKLFYIRRKYTYVDHLIFVFHTQTVLFMLLTLFLIITLFITTESLWVLTLLFLLYLFLSMKKFYQQSYFKTFIKFIMLNFVYIFLGILGTTIVGLISFALF
ncbi:MAG: hypothetical protein ABJH82_13645 [Polaribacter sp.]|uniref:hypothetical protein n=1 Tax=Polaribacter sp. TaxID=1920175 RepID=UPI003263DA18